MTQRDVVKIAGGAVVGFAIAALLGAGIFGVTWRGDTETDVSLYVPGTGGPCTIDKAQYVRTKKGKHVIWKVANHCEGADRAVTVGNFRKAKGPSGETDCSEPGTDYPFTNSDHSKRTATVPAHGDRDIKLKVKDSDELGDEALTVYFDICVDKQMLDPELMIQR